MATNLPISRGRASNGRNYTAECTISDVAPFTVHFRQPKDMAGRYGFDYPRDADRYPVERVIRDTENNLINDYKRLYKGDITKFNNIYLKDAKLSSKLKSKDYLPAWLVLFPDTTTAKYKGGSDMHSLGVKLDLEIQQLIGNTSSLSASKFKMLRFKSSAPNKLIVSPATIPIADILDKGLIKTILNGKKGKTRNDYVSKRAIHIKGVKNELLEEHVSIAVYAVSNSCEALVGELMVHKNNVTYKADLVFVDVTSSSGQSIKKSNDFQNYLKLKSFNQALIRAEPVAETKLDLDALSKNKSNGRVINFLKNIKNGVPKVPNASKLTPKQREKAESVARSEFMDMIKDELSAIFINHSDQTPIGLTGRKIKLNDPYNLRTFVFYLDFNISRINGFAPGDKLSSGKFRWGNMVIIFAQAATNNDTLVHEIGHSLRLPHIFQSGSLNNYEFYQGFSDKLMDYTWHRGIKGRPDISNPNLPRIQFTRYQWYIMQNDTSIYKL